jgi:hypothetical protein
MEVLVHYIPTRSCAVLKLYHKSTTLRSILSNHQMLFDMLYSRTSLGSRR